MGKSSEKFIREREKSQESLPLLSSYFNWDGYFTRLGQTYYKNIEDAKENI